MNAKEATQIFRSYDCWPHATDDFTERWLTTFEALGMLKIDEPKSAREKFVQKMIGFGYGPGSVGMSNAIDAFDASQE